METKVQKMYKEALKKGNVVEAIKLLNYKPQMEITKKVIAKEEVVVETTKEAPVVKTKKKSKK